MRVPGWAWAAGAVAGGVAVGIAITVGRRPSPSSVALDFLTYDAGLTAYLETLGPHYRAGDGAYVSLGNFGGTVNVANMNAMAAQLKAVIPGGVFVAQTGGTPNASDLATAGLSSDFGAISMDWEKAEPGWDETQAGTIAALSGFASAVHAHGYRAIGYLTGVGLGYLNWNYGEIMAGSGVDWLTVETQEAVASGAGPAAVSTLVAQFRGAGVPVERLEVQATVGKVASGKATTTQDVVSTVQAATAAGMSRFFLEFAGTTESDLLAVLQALGR